MTRAAQTGGGLPQTLGQLAAEIGCTPPGPASDASVTSIAFDSRAVEPGSIFVAIPGALGDGSRFVADAVARGAIAVVAERPGLSTTVPVLTVPDGRAALSRLAAAFFGHPSRSLRVVGITGTDGKTSTSHILRGIFQAAGFRTGVSSTIGVETGAGEGTGPGLTTPDPVTVQRSLRAMVNAGCSHAVLEVSSHGLDQRRVEDVRFVAGICTNIDAEHLDYHGTIENYRAAKARLFELVAASQAADRPDTPVIIVNADDPGCRGLPRPSTARALTFGIAGPADVAARDIIATPAGTEFTLVSPWGAARLCTRFVGIFNVSNWLAAASAALAEGVPLETIAAAALTIRPVTGRLETIDAGQRFRVVVDFAHTPQALAASLAALRESTPGRLIAVFGHAGGRDPLNRPRMGQAAATWADIIVLTMDDPYHEDPAVIIEEIRPGLALAGREPAVYSFVDRREAMAKAFAEARPGDTVLVAGRGHETVIEWGARRIAFSDQAVARELLAAIPTK